LKNNADGAAEALHDSPYRSEYVLSEIHRVSGKPAEAWFRVGSANETVIRVLSKALVPSLKLHVGGTEYVITGLQIEEPVVRPGEFVTISPILLRDKETGRSIVHDTPGYKDILQLAMNTQIKNYMKQEGTVKVVHFEHQAVRKRTIKERTVLAQKGRMILDGPEEQLRFLVNHGVGLSPALAFGMVVRVKDGQALFHHIKDDAGTFNENVGGHK